MASMRDIKRRKNSIQSTQQITKAMKLVATAKLQKAKQRAEESKPYFDNMYETVSSILAMTGNLQHPYLTVNHSDNKAFIVVTSNRGLAAGYNSNVVKLVTGNNTAIKNAHIYSVGRKGKEALGRQGYSIAKDYSDIIDEPKYKDAVEIGNALLQAYEAKEISEIYLAYTSFKSTISQEAKLIKLLPIDKQDIKSADSESVLMNYEPSEEYTLSNIIPRYVYSILYGALIESVASEHGARMTAMDSATENASEMIDDLSLEYNRARQASITQELSEIVGGAEALK